MKTPPVDILYATGSKPLHGGAIGNRRFREIFSRLLPYFSVGLIEPSHYKTLRVSEVNGIKVFHIPYVTRFIIHDTGLVNYAFFRGATYFLSPYYMKKVAKKASIVHESMAPLPFCSKLYTGKKTLLTVHQIRGKAVFYALGFLGFAPYVAEKMLKRMEKWYDAFISVSRSSQFELKDEGVTSYLVYNGVDTDVFHPRDLTMEKEETRILTVGRLVPEKGYPILISSAKRIVRKHKKTRFVIIGYGPMEKRIKHLINKMRLSGYFEFYSNLSEEEYVRMLQTADIYVHPNPYQEGFGLVVAEAMSCGKPVVAFDIPGVNEIIRNEIDGFLTPLSINAFTEKIELLIDDERLRERMGQNARGRIVSNFTWDEAAKKMRSIYYELLSNS